MQTGSMVERAKVVVAMSGGVDSSVAACLIHERGVDVVGLFMRSGASEAADPADAGRLTPAYPGCCSAADAADARRVAGKLGVPFYSLNFKDDFDGIIEYFASEYEGGRTPNPCVMCNSRLKFGKLFEYADAVGARYVATGHYARIETRDGRRVLCRGVDDHKDQSYVLFGIPRASLDRVLFPLGAMTKDQVRREARRFGLPVSDKPDSVEICFAPDRDYARVVRERRPGAFREGDVLDAHGKVIGRHGGLPHYTIGQRRGLRIAAGRRVYVSRIDPVANTVTLADGEALLARGLLADGVRFFADPPESFEATAQIRYLHKPAPARVERLGNDRMRVVFREPQRAVTPGQAVVVYEGDMVVGGGWIREALAN